MRKRIKDSGRKLKQIASETIPVYLSRKSGKVAFTSEVDVKEIQHVETVCYGCCFVLRICKFDGISVESNLFKDRRIVSRLAKLIEEVKARCKPLYEVGRFLERHMDYMVPAKRSFSWEL